jgi:hypothetical protein
LYQNKKLNSLEKTKFLLQIINSPYNTPKKLELTEKIIQDLYRFALKNKIGLLFLESLEKIYDITFLKDELKEQQNLQNLQRGTFCRTINVVSKIKCNYAVVKTIFPFSAIPNDIDIIILDNDLMYKKVIEQLVENNFHILGEAPLEVNLRDMTTAKTKDPEAKQWEDIDIYKEIGASHLTYMDKTKFVKYLVMENVNGIDVMVLSNPAELAVSIFHALYPERIYTLLLHFNILYKIKNMNSDDIQDFVTICNEQNMTNVVLETLRVTESIQELCFNEIPEQLHNIREKFGMKEKTTLHKIPYIFPIRVMLNSFWEKKFERKFVYSMLRQSIALFNPKTADFVIKQYKDRSIRDTY